MSSRRDESIAFIGLGQMGHPMARRLVKAGYSVRAFDLSSQEREAFCAAGGRAVSSTREACAEASIIITILPNGKIVHDALLADQAVASASPKALVIEMSSSAPLQTRELEGALSRFGIGIIDAPVSGGVKRATDGTLAIMVGGDSSSGAIAFDLPFHGKSLPPHGEKWWAKEYNMTKRLMMDFPNTLAEALELHRPVYMGSSMGGHLAVDLASNYPEKYRATIAVEGALRSAAEYVAVGMAGIRKEFDNPNVNRTSIGEAMLLNMSPHSPEANIREV